MDLRSVNAFSSVPNRFFVLRPGKAPLGELFDELARGCRTPACSISSPRVALRRLTAVDLVGSRADEAPDDAVRPRGMTQITIIHRWRR